MVRDTELHELGGDSAGAAPDVEAISKCRVFLRAYVVKLATRKRK